jgi:GH25 family lysozyme M1 (1,4-beta-N-acetylmuramidase)
MLQGPLLSLLLLLLSACLSAGYLGVDVSQPVSPSQAACQRKGSVVFGVARAWHSFGSFDPNALTTLASWQKAGIAADVYLFPCAGSNASAQVGSMLQGLRSSNFSRVWLDIESNTSPGCSWGSSKKANCAFAQELLAALAAHGQAAGVYTSIHEYSLLLSDSAEGCQLAQPKVPLWYPHYEKPPQPSFADFSPFGGWAHPTVKQFNDATAGTGVPDCGVGVDVNWAPEMP